MQAGLEVIINNLGIKAMVARQGSAFCLYFMDHCPMDWHDLASNHDFSLDQKLRVGLIDRGIYVFPTPTKQCSISFAHSVDDVELTLQRIEDTLVSVSKARRF